MTRLEPFLHLTDLSKDPVKQRIPGLLTMSGNVLVNAYRKAGKTSLILDLVSALTGEGPFLGNLRCTPLIGPVVYVNIELEQSMLRAYCEGMGIGMDNNDVLVLDYCGRMPRFMLDDEDWRLDLAAHLKAEGASAMIVDPIQPVIAMHGGDSNSNDEARYTMELLGQIRREAELRHLFIVDHTGHADKGRARGASGKEDWADILWNIQSAGDGGRCLTAVGRGIPEHSVTYEQSADGRLRLMDRVSERAGKPTATGQVRAYLIKDGEWHSSAEIQAGTGLDQPRVSEAMTSMHELRNVERKDKEGRGGGFLWRIPTKTF